MSLYFSEIGKLQVGICYFYTFFLIIETFSIRQNYCKLLVAGAGTLDPGVSATDDSIMAARHIGTSQCVRRWVGTSILPPLKVSWLLGRKLTVEENKDIADCYCYCEWWPGHATALVRSSR